MFGEGVYLGMEDDFMMRERGNLYWHDPSEPPKQPRSSGRAGLVFVVVVVASVVFTLWAAYWMAKRDIPQEWETHATRSVQEFLR